MILKSIRFFRPDFIRASSNAWVGEADDCDPKLSKKIDAVEHICNHVSVESRYYMNGWSAAEITEALNDRIIFEKGDEIDRYMSLPYLLIYISPQNTQPDHILEIVN